MTIKPKCRRTSKSDHSGDPLAVTVCPVCQFSYLANLSGSIKEHKKYHIETIDGVRIGSKRQLQEFGTKLDSFILGSTNIDIVLVNVQSSHAVSMIRKCLKRVNKDLGADPERESWSIKNNRKGKIFVCIRESRLIGICTTEIPKDGYWMVYDTCTLVSGIRIPLKIGISRIYVYPKYRKLGIATKLLKEVAKHSIPGTILQRHLIGWSQPSEFGAYLAKKFSGVRHPRSGKILIPVYKEYD